MLDSSNGCVTLLSFFRDDARSLSYCNDLQCQLDFSCSHLCCTCLNLDMNLRWEFRQKLNITFFFMFFNSILVCAPHPVWDSKRSKWGVVFCSLLLLFRVPLDLSGDKAVPASLGR